MNSITWTTAATRQFLKLPAAARTQLGAAIGGLVTFPQTPNTKKLVDAPGYRLRSGNYRALFLFDGKARVVTITKTAIRGEDTY